MQDLKLTRGKAEREFNVRLVLVQAMKHDRKVSGDVNLSIVGDQDGVETTYALAQLLRDDEKRPGRSRFAIFRTLTASWCCLMDLRQSG